MGKYIEIARTALNFLCSTINPICSVDETKITDKIFLRNHRKTIGNNLTFLSWNILRNYKKKKIKNSLNKIFEEHNPSIILIQEAPVDSNHAFYERFPELNAYYAPLHQVKKQNKFYNFKHTGQLILSKQRFTKTEVYQLPTTTRLVFCKNHIIKRIALYTQIKNKNKTIGIYNVHLENACWQSGREKQIRYLLNIINKNKDDIVIIGGDFNTILGKLEKGISLLKKSGFNKLFKGYRLDHFFVNSKQLKEDKSDNLFVNIKAIQLKGKGSDHQPIMLNLELIHTQ